MVSYTFTAQGPPRAKARPRMTRTGQTYTPKQTLIAQRELSDQYRGPRFDGPVSITIAYGRDHQVVTITALDPALRSPMRGDLDNYSKLTLDALNKVAWVDDKQVFELHAFKALKPLLHPP